MDRRGNDDVGVIRADVLIDFLGASAIQVIVDRYLGCDHLQVFRHGCRLDLILLGANVHQNHALHEWELEVDAGVRDPVYRAEAQNHANVTSWNFVKQGSCHNDNCQDDQNNRDYMLINLQIFSGCCICCRKLSIEHSVTSFRIIMADNYYSCDR